MRSKHFTGIKLVELRHISQEFAACYLHTDSAKYLQTFTDQSPKNTDLLLCAAFVSSNNANYFRILPHVFTLAASSGSALAAVRPRDFLHGCHSLPISIASLHRPITQFCSFADLAKSCLQVHKSKFGRSASVQIEVWTVCKCSSEVWKVCKCSDRSLAACNHSKSKFAKIYHFKIYL